MKNLLEYILINIFGPKSGLTVTENADENHLELVINAPQTMMGLIIGKGGKTIKAIRNLVKIKATLENKSVSVEVNEEKK